MKAMARLHNKFAALGSTCREVRGLPRVNHCAANQSIGDLQLIWTFLAAWGNPGHSRVRKWATHESVDNPKLCDSSIALFVSFIGGSRDPAQANQCSGASGIAAASPAIRRHGCR